jgi:hypothetical protein
MSMPPGQPPWPDGPQYEPHQQYSKPSAKRRWPRRHPVWSTLIAILGLLVVIAAMTGAKPAKASHTTADAATSTPAANRSPLKCQARAMSKRPRDHSTVAIRVHTVAHAKVAAAGPVTLLKKQSAAGTASGNDGTRTLRFEVGGATPGTRVVVHVSVSYHGRTGSCPASFWPRAAKAPAPRATQPAAAPSLTHAPPATQPAAAPSSAPAPPATSCYPLSNEGTCYEPGELCRNADHGMNGVAGDGEKITCADNNGWRWEPA